MYSHDQPHLTELSARSFSEIDAPKNLKAVDVQTQTSTVTWSAPQANIDGYILTYRAEDGSIQVYFIYIYM